MNKKLYMVDITAVVESHTKNIDVQYFTIDGKRLKIKDFSWYHIERLEKLENSLLWI